MPQLTQSHIKTLDEALAALSSGDPSLIDPFAYPGSSGLEIAAFIDEFEIKGVPASIAESHSYVVRKIPNGLYLEVPLWYNGSSTDWVLRLTLENGDHGLAALIYGFTG
jgi:hypothetical protein